MRRVIAFMLTVAALALPACYSKPVVIHDGWDDIRKLADKSNAAAQKAQEDSDGKVPPPPDPNRQGYAVLVATMNGPHRHHQAKALIKRLADAYGVEDLWSQDIGEHVLVLRGHYGDPDTDIAHEDLRQTRALTIADKHPYAHATLVALAGDVVPDKPGGDAGQGQTQPSSNPLDLSNHKGMFTLLIGFYDGKDGRANAEKAAQDLRGEGAEAYFMHGEHFSVVTVGLFNDDDFPNGTFGPRVKALQEKYPYYLGNGRTQIDFQKGRRVGEEHSLIMEVQ